MDLGEPYDAGTEILVPVIGEELARVERLRDEHHTRRLEGYLSGRGGALGSEFRSVRTGESAWRIAKNEGMPIWVLASYNPSVDLDELRPGQQLMLPVLSDTVVDTH